MSTTRRKLVILASAVGAWSLLAYACSFDEENPATNRPRGAIEAGSDTGPTTTDTPVGAPLCGKYGGYSNVKTVAAEIVTRASQDCRINSPFANLQGEDLQHFTECFEIFIGSTFQCPESVYVAGQTRDSNGQRCRSMQQAHSGMNLRRADFEAFVEAVGGGLRAKGVSEDDIRALAPSFEGTRTGVVQSNNQPTKNAFCACPDGLYNGQPCEVIVDAGPDAYDASDADADADP